MQYALQLTLCDIQRAMLCSYRLQQPLLQALERQAPRLGLNVQAQSQHMLCGQRSGASPARISVYEGGIPSISTLPLREQFLSSSSTSSWQGMAHL